MNSIHFDMWYGNSLSDIDRIDCFWSDCDCVYRGNVYAAGRAIGDYAASSVQAIEEAVNRIAGGNQ